MSRLAKYPVLIPEGVDVILSGSEITVKGILGSLCHKINSFVSVERSQVDLRINTGINDVVPGIVRAQSGTTRVLLANMVKGVSKGFEKRLILVGVGYRAQLQGDKLVMSLGFSHLIEHHMPFGISFEVPSPTEIIIKGIDKQQVGQVSATIRAYRPPEPYKGKGVRYKDEKVRFKETKKKK